MQINIKKTDSFYFDCDGVILDSNKLKTKAFEDVLQLDSRKHIKEFIEFHKNNPHFDIVLPTLKFKNPDQKNVVKNYINASNTYLKVGTNASLHKLHTTLNKADSIVALTNDQRSKKNL